MAEKASPFIIPALTTDRLILRQFNQKDLDPFSEIVADPEVMRYATYSGKTMSRTQAWNWLCTMLGHWMLRDFGIWGVEDRNSGEFLGRMGLQYLEWFDNVELVWMLKRSAWGQGYAAEAARAAIQFAFQTLVLPCLGAVIHLGNDRSLKLAGRLGMKLEGQIERQNIPFLAYKISKGDWQSSRTAQG